MLGDRPFFGSFPAPVFQLRSKSGYAFLDLQSATRPKMQNKPSHPTITTLSVGGRFWRIGSCVCFHGFVSVMVDGLSVLQRMTAFPAFRFIGGVCPIAACRPRRASSNLTGAAEPFLLPFASAIPLPLRERSGVRTRPVAGAFQAAGIGNVYGLLDVFVADFHGNSKDGESGRGDGIAPVTPPTPPDMRVRIRRFLSDDGDRP